MKTATAILIDPALKRVETVKLTAHSTDSRAHLQEIYALVGTEEVGHMILPNGDSAWGDDNGLLKDWRTQSFFLMPLYAGPLAGRYVITRYVMNAKGGDNLADCHTDAVQLFIDTQWMTPNEVVIPAPTISKMGEDGKMSEPVPLGGGPATWTLDHNPGTPK